MVPSESNIVKQRHITVQNDQLFQPSSIEVISDRNSLDQPSNNRTVESSSIGKKRFADKKEKKF